MNNHHHMLSQVQPVIPLHNGRHQSDMAYGPPARPGHFPQFYHTYQYPYQQVPSSHHFQPQHAPQWYHYQQVSAPVPRPYQPYQPMAPSYPMPSNHVPMLPRPQQPQHLTSPPIVHSHQDVPAPPFTNKTPPVPSTGRMGASSPHLAPPTPPPPPPARRMPYYPPLPWYSFTEGSFPPKSAKARRRKPAPQPAGAPVVLPHRDGLGSDTEDNIEEAQTSLVDATLPEGPATVATSVETSLTSRASSADDSTRPTTPMSAVLHPVQPPQVSNNIKPPSRGPGLPFSIVPAIPNIPLIPKTSKKESARSTSQPRKSLEPSDREAPLIPLAEIPQNSVQNNADVQSPHNTTPPPAQKSAPKSWADLVRATVEHVPKTTEEVYADGDPPVNGFTTSKTDSLLQALSSYQVDDFKADARISFLEPRGLVNTGNMCYMNSILQTLLFCAPFYNFFDRIGKLVAHNFKSETPLMDAMIMFIREFTVIDSATSIKQLKMRLKDNELEQYGKAFIPEFVYEVIRHKSRFSTMRRGHQQDAEEFLGFLLEELHEECARAMKSMTPVSSSEVSSPENGVTSSANEAGDLTSAGDNGWLEVGPRQKAAITRSSGIASDTPITQIFGGKLRSELRVPGMKNSVTLEPYQSLQLDIGSSLVSNIVDALKGLTRPETLHGDFNSPRGPGYSTTKQVTIETLPQVLILHLKRFQYDNAGGTQKIWKKIGYPLELEIPKEVFPTHKRGALLAHGGLPKYRLLSVVYHHGKNASGGHYTVDVRRQDGQEWIRLDDTVIRRVRREEVAEEGSEEDPKMLAAALEQHRNDQFLPNNNTYNSFSSGSEDQSQSEGIWNQVNGTTSGLATGAKKLSGVGNGPTTPTNSSGKMTPVGRSAIKDAKVAYILFYQRIST